MRRKRTFSVGISMTAKTCKLLREIAKRQRRSQSAIVTYLIECEAARQNDEKDEKR